MEYDFANPVGLWLYGRRTMAMETLMARAPNFLGYTDFSGNLGISYMDFLQAREFSGSIQYSIDKQTRAVIDSNERHASILIEQGERNNESLVTINRSMSDMQDQMSSGFDLLTNVMASGFADTIFQLSRANDTLDSLLQTVKNPSQAWAYEQYGIATDAYRRRLYPEALDALKRAINGHGSNVGYGNEFRFHFLQGTIHLGDQAKIPQGLVDPAAAEQHFLTAARYAEHDNPEDAAKALMLAGRAAYIQLNYDIAYGHLDKSLSLDDKNETLYLYAKTLSAKGESDRALSNLETVFIYDPEYIFFALGDLEFEIIRSELKTSILKLHERSGKILNLSQQDLNEYLKILKTSEFRLPGNQTTRPSVLFDNSLRELEVLASSGNSVAGNSITDILDYLIQFEKTIVSCESNIKERWPARLIELVSSHFDVSINDAERKKRDCEGGAGIIISLISSAAAVFITFIAYAIFLGIVYLFTGEPENEITTIIGLVIMVCVGFIGFRNIRAQPGKLKALDKDIASFKLLRDKSINTIKGIPVISFPRNCGSYMDLWFQNAKI